MSMYSLDRPGLAFISLALPIVLWAVLDTRRFFRFLSLGQKTDLTRFELAVIRIPGTIVILGIIRMIVATLLAPK